MIKLLLLLISIVIAICCVVYLFYRKNRSLLKYIIILLIVSIGLYIILQQQEENNRNGLIKAFLKEQKIICDGVTVNSQSFNFVSGTLVFVGKKDTPNRADIFPIEQCNIAKTQE